MPEETKANFFCSQLSLEANEELFGTASKVDVWFLLQYTDTWAAKAFNASGLPGPVKGRLSFYLDSIPDSRIQLIKQGSRSTPPVTFYIVVSRELNSVLYKFRLSGYEDLVSLDIPAIVSGGLKYRDHISKDPVFLVCTNGNRDKCCAKFGLPVYREMSKHENSSVWQCTHVGGHRFAANVLCLPHGIYYGRIRDNEVSALMEEYHKGRIYLERYRGRSCYVPSVQAADYYLRTQTGVRDIAGFRLLEFQNASQDSCIGRFSEINNGNLHSVHVSVEKALFKNYLSCGDSEKSDVSRYRLVEHKILKSGC